mmetsp:Transcript_50911/g.115698  ORF Transcript_50911/g.115698 Transcript_50911/m.115698 type:complete len:567 (+) Transcript_50911:61-1761(+)
MRVLARHAFRRASLGGTCARAFSAYPHAVVLPKDSNQALGIGQYAIDFINGKYGETVDDKVWERIEMFHTDSVMCGVSALAMKTNAPTVLRNEALTYKDSKGATVFGSGEKVSPEKAVVANASAVREWDSNGTVFGYNPSIPGHTAGEFGHNDFYPVVVAAAQVTGSIDGKKALRAMIASDEIRGRLAEVFSLKSYKIDHVVHGAIASAAVYGALLGATPEQIESAIGMAVAHYIPFRAIRAGRDLSDSKGSSAAISTEAAVLSMRRAMAGFAGPKDIFRNPESIFRFFEPTTGSTASNKDIIDITLGNKQRWGPGDAPFNLVLSHSGSDFAVMGMHFKLGLYEHQSAGALQGVVNAVLGNPDLLSAGPAGVKGIEITAYEPAYGIIGDPAKKDPQTRQSADHSMAFIVSRMLLKAFKTDAASLSDNNAAWKSLMLSPYDYGHEALWDKDTREMMQKISFKHGGPEFDAKYPDGIPTAMDISLESGKTISSGLVMYPSGHARDTAADLKGILHHKAQLLGGIAIEQDEFSGFHSRLVNMVDASAGDMQSIYTFDYNKLVSHPPIDG